MITDRDPETFFDQRPSHPARPVWVLLQQNSMNLAWCAYHAEIDVQLDAVKWDNEKLKALRRAAVLEEAKYYRYCDCYNRGETPPGNFRG